MTDILEKFSYLPPAAIAFGQGDKGVINPNIKPMWKPIKILGRAFTIKSKPGDNLAVHIAISEAPPGSVIALDVDNHKEHACVGDIIIRNCIARKFAGFVTNGVMRDLGVCRNLGLPIYATGVCIRGPSKVDKGIIGGRITLGGVNIDSGDYIIGDDDGLVVVRPDNVESVLSRAIDKEKSEDNTIERISKGENTIDIFKLK